MENRNLKEKSYGKSCIKINVSTKKENRLFRWMRKIANGSLPELRIETNSSGLHISIKWSYPVQHKTPWDEYRLFAKLIKDLKVSQGRSLNLPLIPIHVIEEIGDEFQSKINNILGGGNFSQSLKNIVDTYGVGMRKEDIGKLKNLSTKNKEQ